MKRKLLTLGIKIAIIFVSIFVLFVLIFRFVRVSTNAMAPNVMGGDLALIYRLDKKYEVGDVVTFKRDGKRYFLRVIAVDSGVVSIHDGMFFINDVPEDSSHAFIGDFIDNPANYEAPFPYVVTPGTVFVAGDNRDEDNDSRTFGAISVDEIDGKVISIMRTRGV